MKKKNLFLSVALSSCMIIPSAMTPIFAEEKVYEPGVTVEKNTNEEYEADYQVTFVYEDKDEKNAIKVSVAGNFQFYDVNDEAVKEFEKSGNGEGAKAYSVFEYKDGMFNTGYGLNNDSISYDFIEVIDERFELTLPVPGNEYYYDYTITYDDGTVKTIQDPANPSVSNSATGHDSGHSLFYVGNKDNTIKGQEYIYPRTDGKTGTYSFVEYEAVDGTKQPLAVYLPYGYDSTKTYKTIYVSHGGGGNEAEWMEIGSAKNIMDNLIAEKEVAEAVVVTMDHTYFGWNYITIAKNFKENIIPFIEENYSVSKEVNDRAMCGLSMGSMTTSTLMLTYTDLFGNYGCFSGSNVGNTEITDLELLKNVNIYITAGNLDMALRGPGGNSLGMSTVGLVSKLEELEVKHGYDIKLGAHDWGVWREAFTTFVKDYLWDVEAQTPTTPDDVVKTGDSQILGMYAMLTLCSAGLYISLRKKVTN